MKLQLAGWLLGAALLSAAWGAPEPENPFVLAGQAAQVGPAGSASYPLPLRPGTYVAKLRDAPGRRCWQETFSVH